MTPDIPAPAGRRNFIKLTTAGGAALAAPNLLLAQKTDAKRAVVGEGEWEFECEHDWGVLPDGHSYGNASHGVTIDKAGNVYITHQGNPGSVFVFDPHGKFVRAMGEIHVAKGVGKGHGIDIRDEGGIQYLYLTSSTGSRDGILGACKMTLAGEVVWQTKYPKESGKYAEKNPRYRPTNISFHPDGGFFLGDGYGSGYIHRYDKDGKYLSTFGGTGREDGKFRTPHGQWLDTRDGTPKIAICDRANARLQWFDLDGKHLKTLGGFLFPADIDIQGDIMLVPDLHCRVTLLDKDDKVLVHLGDDDAWRAEALKGMKMRGKRPEWKPGRFVHPHDACFDKDGNIFVSEWVSTGRVTKLRKLG